MRKALILGIAAVVTVLGLWTYLRPGSGDGVAPAEAAYGNPGGSGRSGGGFRPILMTSLTAILGLVPMSLAMGEGSEIQAPLARVVIGGLITSTLVTLVFVPTVYTEFEEGWKGLRRGLHHEAPKMQSGD